MGNSETLVIALLLADYLLPAFLPTEGYLVLPIPFALSISRFYYAWLMIIAFTFSYAFKLFIVTNSRSP